ncbi:bacteriocin resistance YdeI/OmpD-like protein [Mucilaginibacter gracilis]|uniref:Bacteriocin resistance YdeI/OmpD-like protein n=1 Tax=Mucilaginibacter gracilis TaxID=423350 RepID=A0A495J2B5_9SPHI|nr:YdeI/OmpD-associated family protein [Mucilaginibacter gracilis]RKR82498.1 bacteriocin resistance YdeI/OmpD-like protein [Mucilaginibacter gracilis]
MLIKGEHIEGTPAELQVLLDQEANTTAFFESLSKSYKQGYCDWVGSAKQEDTRKVMADMAMIMLRNKQKTLKT